MMGLCDSHGCQGRLGVPGVVTHSVQVSDHRFQPSNASHVLDGVLFSLRQMLQHRFPIKHLNLSAVIADSAKL
jgi:hypothetical protein